MKPLPAFLKDTDIKVHFRTYYFNRNNPDDSKNEALATGGWISYQSGWLANTFAMGATLYGSAKLYGPEDRDGTTLLKPSQESYYVPGEAWGALKYQDYVILKGYRQQVDQGYINPQDNRMTPNTFQGVTVGGKVGWVEYLGGYLWKIKPRNADEFISMSEQAGAKNTDDGVGFGGVRLVPLPGLRLDFSDSYGVNTFNTFYAEGVYEIPIADGLKIRLGAQYTSQRAVGDALLPAAGGWGYGSPGRGGPVSRPCARILLTGVSLIMGREDCQCLALGAPLDDRPGTSIGPRRGDPDRRGLRFAGSLDGAARAETNLAGAGTPSIRPWGRRRRTSRKYDFTSIIGRPSSFCSSRGCGAADQRRAAGQQLPR